MSSLKIISLKIKIIVFSFLFLDISCLLLAVFIRYCCLFPYKSDQDLCWYHLSSELLWLAATSVQLLLWPFAVSHFLVYPHVYNLCLFLSGASTHASWFQNYLAVPLPNLSLLPLGLRDRSASHGLRDNWSISYLILYPIIVKYVQSTMICHLLSLFNLLPLSGNVNEKEAAISLRIEIV